MFAIAKWLILGQAARAPGVLLAFFDFDLGRIFGGDFWLVHVGSFKFQNKTFSQAFLFSHDYADTLIIGVESRKSSLAYKSVDKI